MYDVQQAEIVGIVAEELGMVVDKVTPESTLESLGADSLDSVALTMELEHRFSIVIDDFEMERVKTISDLFALVKGKTDE